MRHHTFQVETREQAAVILGGSSALTASLIEALIERGVHAVTLKNLAQLTKVQNTHDPDYIIVFADTETQRWARGEGSAVISSLKPLIDSGQSQLITIENASVSASADILGHPTKRLVVANYLAGDELVCPRIDSWLSDIQTNHSLTISGDGLQEISILSLNDLVGLLTAAILDPGSLGATISFESPITISELNLAYLLRTSLPFKVELVFVPSRESRDTTRATTASIASYKKLGYIPSSSPPLEELQEYFRSHIKRPAISKVAKLTLDDPMPESRPVKKLSPLIPPTPVFVPLESKKRKPLFPGPARPARRHGPPRLRTIVARGLVIALALYLGTLAFVTTVTALSLRHMVKTVQTNELPHISPLNKLTLTYVRANWAAWTSLPGVSTQSKVKDVNLMFDIYEQSLSTLSSAQLLSDTTKELTHFIFGSGEADAAQLLSLNRLHVEELYERLSLLEGYLPSKTPSLLVSKYDKQYQEGRTKIAQVKRSVTTTKALLATIPDVIALGGRRKYAVLFQNNMELRATGGFIGSFGIMSFENGKLYDLSIFDVYEADGQLKGHVEPPGPIKSILGEANWYLRDSNFDPDFPTSARHAEWFIKKSLSQDLDGTIALNLNSLKAILRVTGPLEIPDYNETITEGNLYERAQFHAEVNFFPGSTQKKEFLSTVANTLFARLPTVSAEEGIKLMMALTDSIENKDTLISLKNPGSAQVFQVLGWDGQLRDLPCPAQENCHGDYTMVVDSNFGVNKANYFVDRKVEQIITLNKDLLVEHSLRLEYNNTATSTAWPAGAYKNYQRIYLPVGANVNEVKIDGKTLAAGEFTLQGEHNRVVLSHLINVPVTTTMLVEITYTTPQLTRDKEFVYSWHWQKQPGAEGDEPLTVYLNYPLYLLPSVVSPAADLSPQQLKFNMKNDTDHRVTVKFSQ